jgi:tetratricopeptide (TPR) repeat protein
VKKKTAAILVVVVVAIVGCLLVLFNMPSRIDRLRTMGRIALAKGQPGRAVGHLKNAVALSPEHEPTRRELMRALIEDKQFGEALKEVKALIGVGVPEAEAAFLEARIYVARGKHRIAAGGSLIDPEAVDRICAEEIDRALALCGKHIKRYDDKADGYTFAGDILFYRMSIQVIKVRILRHQAKVSLAARQESEYRDRMGKAHRASVDIRNLRMRAALAYKSAVGAGGDTRRARLALARLALTEFVPNGNAAKEQVQLLLAANPMDAEALVMLSDAQFSLGEDKEALASIRRVPEGSRTLQIILKEAQILDRLGMWAELRDLLIAIPRDGRSKGTIAYYLGRGLAATGQTKDAVSMLQSIFADIKVKWSPGRYEIGLAMLKLGKHSQAISAFKKAIYDAEGLRPRTTSEFQLVQKACQNSRVALARLLRAEESERARQYAVQAFDYDPGDAEVAKLAREIFLQAGLIEKADKILLTHLAVISRRKGAAEALQAIEQAFAQRGAPRQSLYRLKAAIHAREGQYREAAKSMKALVDESPEKVEYALVLGRLYGRLGAYDNALVIYDRLVEEYPGDARVLAAKIEILIAADRLPEAKVILERSAVKSKSDLLRQRLLQIYMNDGRLDEAISLVRLQTKVTPRSAQTHALLAELFFKKGDFSAARDAYITARRLDPENKASLSMGILDMVEQRPEAAQVLYVDCSIRFPKWYSGRLYHAVSLYASGRTDEAITEFTEALKLRRPGTPGWDMGRWLLAVAYAGRGESEMAAKVNRSITSTKYGFIKNRLAYLLALSRSPERERLVFAARTHLMLILADGGLDHEALKLSAKLRPHVGESILPEFWYGHALVRGKRFKAAKTYYEKLAAKYPGDVATRIALAELLARDGETTEAVAHLEKALALADIGLRAGIHVILAKRYEEDGRTGDAANHYRSALKLRPGYPYALNNLAWLVATKENNPKAALIHAKEAARLSPNDSGILDTLAWILYLNGETEEAIRVLKRILPVAGSIPTIRYHLGMAYLKQGQRDKARFEFEEALNLSASFEHADEIRKILKSL